MAELGVRELLEVIAAAVLEEQQLLGDQNGILGNPVEGRVVAVERPVGFLDDVDERGRLADEERPAVDRLDAAGGLLDAPQCLRILEPVLAPGVDQHLGGGGAPQPAVDQLAGDANGVVGGQPLQRHVGEVNPEESRADDGDEHQRRPQNHPGAAHRQVADPHQKAL